MTDQEKVVDHELEHEAWNVMNRIYERVHQCAPWVINTTAWYDFGCPIIVEALKKQSEKK